MAGNLKDQVLVVNITKFINAASMAKSKKLEDVEKKCNGLLSYILSQGMLFNHTCFVPMIFEELLNGLDSTIIIRKEFL